MTRNNTQPVEFAIGYIRVSTEDQADSGLGLADQRSRVTAYCDAQGWPILTMFEEAASGKTIDRPELIRALALLGPGRVLVVLKLDRLVRRIRLLWELIDHMQEVGGEFASVTESVDTTTASGRLILNVLASMAEWERDTIGERTTAALRQLRAQRRPYCRAPYGYKIVRDANGARWEPEPHQQAAMARIRELRAGGMRLMRIAEQMSEEGWITRSGTTNWAFQTVWEICRRNGQPPKPLREPQQT